MPSRPLSASDSVISDSPALSSTAQVWMTSDQSFVW